MLMTSARVRNSLTMSSVTFSVSESREPGGSSMASSERAVSCAGRNPCDSSDMLQIDSANITRPAQTVAK